MKHITISAMAAMSAIALAQPSLAQSGYQLSDLNAVCCGSGNSANAQFVPLVGRGVVAQLQTTQPNCCDSTYAYLYITLNGNLYINTPVNKEIRFTASGANNPLPPASNFGVLVDWKTPSGANQDAFFTVANGGLTTNGTNYKIRTGTGTNQIPAGSTIVYAAFEVFGNCVSSTQTALINNVYIDNQPVGIDLQNEPVICSGGCS